MLFMVIESFDPARIHEVYARLESGGRGLPEGVRFVDSWVEVSLGRCFQLMECSDAARLQEWVSCWTDLVHFEVVPVVPSQATRDLFARRS